MNLNAGRNTPTGTSSGFKSPGFWTSGYWTPGLITALSLVLLFLAYNHRRGNFHRLKSAMLPTGPSMAAPLQVGPGGMPTLRISRPQSTGGVDPEFLSTTMMPGRGAGILQITAAIPGRGEVELLQTPNADDLMKVLSGTGSDMYGAHAETLGGEFLGPWSGHLNGTPAGTGNIKITWQGKAYILPGDPSGSAGQSILGLMLGQTNASLHTNLLKDGAQAHAEIGKWNFLPQWPSYMTTVTDVQLQSDFITMTLTLKNDGEHPMPAGIGWHPLFRLVSGHPENVRLTIPSSVKLVMGANGVPTGAEQPVERTAEDFTSSSGTPLGKRAFDVHYVGLQRATTADGPMIVIRDPEAGYGLRIVLIDGDQDEFHLQSKPGEPWVTLTAGTNREDPLGPEWKNDDSGMRILNPGESMTFRLRLEIFSVDDEGPPGAP